MILINSIDTASFTLNGTRYVKNFVCLPAGQTHIQIVGAYDTKLQILGNTPYNQVQVDGNTYGSQQLLINALANVIFSKTSSSATINQNNVGVFNTTIQYSFTTPSNTILVSEIVNKINLTYGYAISEVQTPYFFQFVRPAVQEGSDTPIQKKYIYLFTGGKGSYGLGHTPVASTQFKLIVESVLNPDDVINDDSAIINYLGEIEDGDYISVANESNWDFFDTDYNYYFSYVTDGVLFYVIFIGEPGLYGVDNVLFTEDDFVDSTNSDALPYIPTLQEVITQGSTATTNHNLAITLTSGATFTVNGSQVVTNAKIGVANGIVPTDNSNKIPVAYLPNAVMIYKGVWNLSTNTPALANGTGTAGWVYKVTGASTPTNFNFGAGNVLLTNGDFVIYSDTGTWEKSDGSDAVTSVNGYQGVVSLGYADVGAAPTVHTHAITDVTGLNSALDGKANTNGSNASGSWPINVTGTAANANLVNSTGGAMHFNWADGLVAGVMPTWLWGGSSPSEQYVFSPSVLSVGGAVDAINWLTTAISDFNSPTGFKLLETNTGSPSNGPGGSWGQGIQFSTNHNPDYINQLAFNSVGALSTRTKFDGTWGAWTTVPTNDALLLHTTGNETKYGGLVLNGSEPFLGFTVKRGSVNAVFLGSASGAGTDTLGILQLTHSDGVERVRLYASGDSWINPAGGKFGVGTQTPLTKLDVWDNTSDELISGRLGSAAVQAFTIGGYNTDSAHAGLIIKTNNASTMTEAMRITYDGQVNIPTGNVKAGVKHLKSNSIVATSGADRWVKLFTTSSENNLIASIDGNMTSSNSVQAFTINIRGGYYDSTDPYYPPFIEVSNGTYNERLQEVMVLKESNRFAVYVKVKATDQDVSLFWNLDSNDNGDVTVNNTVTNPSSTTGSFVLPTASFLKANNYGNVQLRNGNNGIGIMTPEASLDVLGEIQTKGAFRLRKTGVNDIWDAKVDAFGNYTLTNLFQTATPYFSLASNGDADFTNNLTTHGTFTVNGGGYSLAQFQSSGINRGFIGQGDYAIPSGFSNGFGVGAINNLQLGAGNAVAATILSDGKFGIGTTAPIGKLHIADGSGGSQLAFTRGSGGALFGQALNEDGLILYLGITGSNVSQRWHSTGNVSIGTATDGGYKLHVNGTGNFVNGLNIGTGENITWGGTYSSGKPTIAADINSIAFYPSGATYGGKPAMIMSPLNKVAIGMTTLGDSNATFSVSGSSDFFGTINTNSSATFGGQVLVYTPDGSSPYAAVNIDYLDAKLNGLPQIINNTTVSALNNTSLNGTYPSVPIGTQIVCGAVGTGVIYVKINNTSGGTWRQMYLSSL